MRIASIAEGLYEALAEAPEERHRDIIRSALRLLRTEGMLSREKEFMDAFKKVADAKEGAVRATVSSRHGLQEGEADQVRSFLREKYWAGKVVIEEGRDPSLLGGVRIQVGHTVYDASIRGRLSQLEHYLLNK